MIHRDHQQHQQRLAEEDDHHIADGANLVGYPSVVPQLDGVLHADIQQNQRPRHVVLGVEGLPVEPGALADIVQEVHIQHQGDMVPKAVAAVHIDIKRGEVPDLDDGQTAQDVGQKGGGADKAPLHMVEQGVVAADDIDENQVIYQL